MIDIFVTKDDVYKECKTLALGGDNACLIDNALKIVNACFSPNYVKQNFSISKKDGKIIVDGTNLVLYGKSIYTHLAECDEIALIGVTVGAELDREIEKKKITDIAEAYVLDLCASVAVEKIADAVENIIREEERAIGNGVTARFSCGYGDFPLSTQKKIIEVLQLDKLLGVRLSEGDMMLPTKSVTAVLGIGKNVTAKSGRCLACPKKNSCNGGLCSD